MGGAFQTSREIFGNGIWNDVPKFRIFFYIYGNAVFSEDGVRKGNVHIQRGQFLRSFRNLREDLQYIENRSIKKYSLSLISRKVDQLIKEERLKIEDTELGTLFTVVNYALYQGLDNYKNNNENAERTEREQTENGDGTQREQKQNNNKNVKKVQQGSNKYSDEFEKFWSVYPRKSDKPRAAKTFKTKNKKYGLETIIEGTKKYVKQIEKDGTETKFIKLGSTFLNNDCFLDEYDEVPQKDPYANDSIKPPEDIFKM